MRVCTYILLQVFIDSYVCVAAHGLHETFTIRIVIRCHALAAERGGGTVAGDFGLAELAAQSMHSGGLSGLFVRRAASELCPVWPGERTAYCGLRSRGARARGAALRRQWARPAGAAATGCAALCQSVEARASESLEAEEERKELSGVESNGTADQFCRLGTDATGQSVWSRCCRPFPISSTISMR